MQQRALCEQGICEGFPPCYTGDVLQLPQMPMQLHQGRRGRDDRREKDASGGALLWLPYDAQIAFIQSQDPQSGLLQVILRLLARLLTLTAAFETPKTPSRKTTHQSHLGRAVMFPGNITALGYRPADQPSTGPG